MTLHKMLKATYRDLRCAVGLHDWKGEERCFPHAATHRHPLGSFRPRKRAQRNGRHVFIWFCQRANCTAWKHKGWRMCSPDGCSAGTAPWPRTPWIDG